MSTNSNALISIIDDDESLRGAVEGLIASLGFRVQGFPSAIDFLTSARIADTCCIIADVQMPQMSGTELHRRLAELGHAIPTILITAYPNDRIRNRALADGVVGYLTKPFDDDVLIGCIHSALRTKPPAKI